MGELNSVIEWLVLARNEKCLPGEEAAFDKAIEILKAQEPGEVTKQLKALSAFKSYFDSLYGQGLEVANWHLNGATESFDNFYDSAMEEYENARCD